MIDAEIKTMCCEDQKNGFLWYLFDFEAQDRQNVSVRYHSNRTTCSLNHLVQGPRPDFTMSVNKSNKTIAVEVDSDDPVEVRWCYENSPISCREGHFKTISRSALLSIPHLLPCVCVEARYIYTDAVRHKKCPFHDENLIDIREVLLTSTVEPYTSHLSWSPECPESTQNVSAALCWKLHDDTCIPVPNSTLEKKYESALKFKTSSVDQHPQMCVKFSIKDSYNISCLFTADKTSWETHITPGRQSMSVHITPTVPAEFSAQLCVLTDSGCEPRGHIHSETTATNHWIKVPILDVTERPCVQVWQSDPALSGRRILCWDYKHNRWGVYAVGVLVVVFIGILLGFFIHRASKRGIAGWLTIQKPLLVVCSSDQSTHISAVCALASTLREELDASVQTALWAQSSQTLAGNGASVADLGPLPWLYGQWDAIRKAKGKMLIVWSPEAKRTYQKWRERRANTDYSWNPDKVRSSVHDYLKMNGWILGKAKKEKHIENKGVECSEDNDSQKELSTVIKPVFVAALAALEGALQEGKSKDVTIVYFQGLCHSRDIPKAFRGVPRYCLPQEFSGLIQELAEVRGETKSHTFRWHCWARLMSKVLSVWLARQLTQKLQMVVPQTTAQSVSSSIKTPSDQTESRWKLPLIGTPSSRQELLHGSL